MLILYLIHWMWQSTRTCFKNYIDDTSLSQDLMLIISIDVLRKMDLNVEFNGAKGWPMDANVVFYHKPKVRQEYLYIYVIVNMLL